jgi:hypothetical protein
MCRRSSLVQLVEYSLRLGEVSLHQMPSISIHRLVNSGGT